MVLIGALLVTVRLLEIVGGVAIGELNADAGRVPTPDAGMIILDVTARPDMKVGCVYSGTAAPDKISTPDAMDTCAMPAPAKVISSTTIAGQLTAAEWTLLQAKIAAGDKASAFAASTLLSSSSTVAQSSAAVDQLVAQSVVAPVRASAIKTALAGTAVTP